jgi:hypothetical protein
VQENAMRFMKSQVLRLLRNIPHKVDVRKVVVLSVCLRHVPSFSTIPCVADLLPAALQMHMNLFIEQQSHRTDQILKKLRACAQIDTTHFETTVVSVGETICRRAQSLQAAAVIVVR